MICPNCRYVFVPDKAGQPIGAALCRRCYWFIADRPPDWHDIRPYRDRLRIFRPPEEPMPDYLTDYLKLTGHC